MTWDPSADSSLLGFAENYQFEKDTYSELADVLEKFVVEQLSDKSYDLHVVSARAKKVSSVRQKLLEKGYKNPELQMTDLIGVRIITYYSEQVDPIANRLREAMTVDAVNSLDKRQQLIDSDSFGYRSVHIVGKLATRLRRDSRYSKLAGQTFEVQVRSVLDHAWAEIEHELVYKSGATFPAEFKRRFAAVAGAFEILEREFVSLREAADDLIGDTCAEYRAGRSKSRLFDGASLRAALEVQRPHGRTWRQASRSGVEFPPITTVLAAFNLVGITNWSSLASALRRQGIRGKLEDYASLAGVASDEVSHLACCAVIIGVKDLKVLNLYLPDIAETPEFIELFGLSRVGA